MTQFIDWLVYIHSSTGPQNKVHTTVSSDNITYLAHLEGISGILKWSLHLTSLKPSKITSPFVRRAVRLLLGQLSKFGGITIDLSRVVVQDLDSFRLGSCDIGLRDHDPI